MSASKIVGGVRHYRQQIIRPAPMMFISFFPLCDGRALAYFGGDHKPCQLLHLMHQSQLIFILGNVLENSSRGIPHVGYSPRVATPGHESPVSISLLVGFVDSCLTRHVRALQRGPH